MNILKSQEDMYNSPQWGIRGQRGPLCSLHLSPAQPPPSSRPVELLAQVHCSLQGFPPERGLLLFRRLPMEKGAPWECPSASGPMASKATQLIFELPLSSSLTGKFICKKFLPGSDLVRPWHFLRFKWEIPLGEGLAPTYCLFTEWHIFTIHPHFGPSHHPPVP